MTGFDGLAKLPKAGYPPDYRRITLSQFRELVTAVGSVGQREARNVSKAFDCNDDGNLDMREFECGVAILFAPRNVSSIGPLPLWFRIFDADASGTLDRVETHNLLQSTIRLGQSGNSDQALVSELVHTLFRNNSSQQLTLDALIAALEARVHSVLG